jgi:hypothetical protein
MVQNSNRTKFLTVNICRQLVHKYSHLVFNMCRLVPLVEVSLQFHGFTPFVATASAAVKGSGCRSSSKRSSILKIDLPFATKT